MSRKSEAEDAWDNIAELLHKCGPDGLGTLEIRDIGSRPSSTGRTHYLGVRVWVTRDGKPECVAWLSYNVAKALGYRFNKPREAVSMGGYGYSREHQLASHLASKAGHPIRVECPGGAFAPNGWVNP